MAWAEIRWGRAVWEIPAEKSKSGEATDVVLTSLMLELLERRRRDPAADLVWVFPGPGRTGHLVEAKTAWARILKRAHIKDCRIHDLRRTLGSWQALQGTSLAIIGASLGHQSLQGTHILCTAQCESSTGQRSQGHRSHAGGHPATCRSAADAAYEARGQHRVVEKRTLNATLL